MLTVLLLIASATIKTVAWYWFLKPAGTALALPWVVLISWAIALGEYCLLIPANWYGSRTQGGPFTPAQLFVLAEGLGIIAFLVFAALVLKQPPRWQELAGMGLVLGGLALALSARPAA